MKTAFCTIAAAVMLALAGCTSIESTQKFNAVNLGVGNEKAVCQTHVTIPGYFFFGLPILTGSNGGDGKMALFTWALTTENAVYLLTREVKSKGASRLINVNVMKTEESIGFLPFMSYRTIQASGTGVRSREAAVRQAEKEFDRAQ